MRVVKLVCDRCAFESGDSKDFEELPHEGKHLCNGCWDAYMDLKRKEAEAVAELWRGFWREVPAPKPEKPKRPKV